MLYKKILSSLSLYICFIVHNLQSSYNFKTHINKDLVLKHTYPQQIISKTEINVSELLNILLPCKNGRPKIENHLTKNQDNTFMLTNVSFFPDQHMVAIYNKDYKKIDILSTKDNHYITNVPLDKDLTMDSFFLDYYVDKNDLFNQSTIHLFIVYKTKEIDILYIAEKKINIIQKLNIIFPSEILWRKIQVNRVFVIKNGYIKGILDTNACYENFGNIPSKIHKAFLEIKYAHQFLPKSTNNTARSILLFSGSILLFLILWYTSS